MVTLDNLGALFLAARACNAAARNAIKLASSFPQVRVLADVIVLPNQFPRRFPSAEYVRQVKNYYLSRFQIVREKWEIAAYLNDGEGPIGFVKRAIASRSTQIPVYRIGNSSACSAHEAAVLAVQCVEDALAGCEESSVNKLAQNIYLTLKELVIPDLSGEIEAEYLAAESLLEKRIPSRDIRFDGTSATNANVSRKRGGQPKKDVDPKKDQRMIDACRMGMSEKEAVRQFGYADVREVRRAKARVRYHANKRKRRAK